MLRSSRLRAPPRMRSPPRPFHTPLFPHALPRAPPAHAFPRALSARRAEKARKCGFKVRVKSTAPGACILPLDANSVFCRQRQGHFRRQPLSSLETLVLLAKAKAAVDGRFPGASPPPQAPQAQPYLTLLETLAHVKSRAVPARFRLRCVSAGTWPPVSAGSGRRLALCLQPGGGTAGTPLLALVRILFTASSQEGTAMKRGSPTNPKTLRSLFWKFRLRGATRVHSLSLHPHAEPAQMPPRSTMRVRPSHKVYYLWGVRQTGSMLAHQEAMRATCVMALRNASSVMDLGRSCRMQCMHPTLKQHHACAAEIKLAHISCVWRRAPQRRLRPSS